MLLISVTALSASIFLGGGTTTFQLGDLFAEAICFPLLVVASVSLARERWSSSVRWSMLIAALVVLLPIIQLVPLPPAAWTTLPGRTEIADAFRFARSDLPWLGLSLAPGTTRQALFSLIPPLTIFVACIQIDIKERYLMICVLSGLAFISVAVGLLQVTRISENETPSFFQWSAYFVGFFSNRNHLAALLAVVILILTSVGLIAVLELATARNGPHRIFSVVKLLPSAATVIALGVFLIGIGLAQSRAGFGLAIVAIVLGFCFSIFRARRQISVGPIALLAIIMIAMILFSVNYVLYDILQRVNIGVVDVVRDKLIVITTDLVMKYFPFGSGFGTFPAIFEMHEIPATSFPARANRAHNDFLEWGLEGGGAAYAILILGIIWLIWVNYMIWFRWEYPSLRDAALSRACGAAPFLVLMHSSVDYPLRTISLASVTAMCIAFAVEPLKMNSSVPSKMSFGNL